MKPLKLIQTKLHTENQKGNCFATVIACFLHKNVSDIPPFEELMDFENIHNTDWINATNNYLYGQGWEWGSLDDHLYTEEFYLVTGKSPRGISHCCIYQKGKLYHDPHPDQAGLLSEDYFEYLSKIENDIESISSKIRHCRDGKRVCDCMGLICSK